MENGVLRMHRTISSDDVEGYASHLPKDEVKLQKDEDIVYSKGVLTSASGTTLCKLMPKVLMPVLAKHRVGLLHMHYTVWQK